ncbi:hypothetical protein RN001_006448 [Aquatica leii]|uniref:BZIP domain-containing protein n=1 Tax=Aquatica leii TaxID=1421715 RepID=A0AAN7Q1R5_9COLE|nr:hypothetical protein RN001_006448 [Aquatica leii]
MLNTNEPLLTDEYVFKSSPESSGDDSFMSDYFDNPSDEDFLQQLSSDLDIPLLLNQGDEEMSLLNSFLDKSTDEILSEISSPGIETKWQDVKNELNELHQLDLSRFGPEAFPNVKAEIKTELPMMCIDECSQSDLVNYSSEMSMKNVHSQTASEISFVDNSITNVTNLCPTTTSNVVLTHQPVTPQNLNLKLTKLSPKRITFSSKVPYIVPTNKNKQKILLVPSTPNVTPKFNGTSPQKIVILDNVVSTVPIDKSNLTCNISTPPPIAPISNSVTITAVNNISPTVTVPSLSPLRNNIEEPCLLPPIRNQAIDARALKRQQRMIKNRESACLSRKKKKDYVTSLEFQVQKLTEENDRLVKENIRLKEQLSSHLQSKVPIFTIPTAKTFTKTLAVCAVFCVMSLNINYLQSPHRIKNQGIPAPVEQNYLDIHHSRSLLWTSDVEAAQDNILKKNDSDNILNMFMCPMHVNQSENVRLALELHRLIGKPYNISNEFNKNDPFAKKPVKRKDSFKKSRKNLEGDTIYSPSLYKMNRRQKRVAYSTSINNELQIFSPTIEQSYAEFFEAINRQDDTFYLVSFNSDHLLLPALNHNKTRRPKMSLLLPSILSNVSSASSQQRTVSLMQIDCEVIDTHLLHVNYGAIPRHLRNNSNTSQETFTPTDTLGDLNNTHDKNFTVKKIYKPYFMRKNYLNLKNTTNGFKNKHRRNRKLT